MRSRFFRAAALLLSIGLASSAQTQTADQQALKDSLSPEQQSALLQGAMRKGDGTGKTTDKKLDTPDTMAPKNGDSTGQLDETKKGKTVDGRILRQLDENPELRADDTVIIDLTPNEYAGAGNGSGSQNNANGNNGVNGSGVANGSAGVNGVNGTNGVAGGNAGNGNGVSSNSQSML